MSRLECELAPSADLAGAADPSSYSEKGAPSSIRPARLVQLEEASEASEASEALTLGSLFSGIGGLEMGLELALGATTIWQVEKDSYARQALATSWPEASRDVHDIREAGARNLQRVDILCGGFPCQGLSVAGKGRGLEDERSSLWFEMLRVIRELRPSVVVLENVPAIRTRGLGVVLGGLASIGYDAQWGVFGAADVGAPHRRQRWWCVAYLPNAIGGILRKQLRGRRGEGRQGPPQSGPDGEVGPVADADSRRLQGLGESEPAREQSPHRGIVDGRRGSRGVDGPPMGDTPGQRPPVGVSQQPDPRQELASSVRASRETHEGDAESLLGGTPDGVPGWAYSGGEVEAWEMAPRTIVSGADPNRVQRLRCLGNAVVPRWSYWVGMKVREILGE